MTPIVYVSNSGVNVMAWSPYRSGVTQFVRDNPGCCKLDVARHLALRCNPTKLYRIVNTAIRHGWIYAIRCGGRYYLYVADQQITPSDT
jgi:hypothetical protein